MVNKNFQFGKKCCGILFFKQVKTNIFITLSDLKFKPIITKTTGLAHIGNSKRKKLSTQSLHVMLYQLKKYFLKFKLCCFILLLRLNVTYFVKYLCYWLKNHKYNINAIIIRMKRPHCKLRFKNIRRV